MKKQCRDCKETKPLAEFYKHSQMADGRLNKCKSCVKDRVARHRLRNIDRIRAYDRARGNRQKPSYYNEYQAKYPNKYKAHNMVKAAIRGGKLFREPCKECGSKKRVHAHHDDYLKPLNVRWLCSAHHKQWHLANGEGKNG